MALLLILKEQNIPLHAITVDHGLRSESGHEAMQVAAWCKALGVPHTTLHWRHKNISSGIPEKAREARYGLMTDWCKKNNIRHLYTAHHLDDQIETILFRLTRGSGLVGLSGMLPTTERYGITLHRPLLATPKSELLSLLRDKKQAYLEDPSNQNPAFTRNAIRIRLQSLTPAQKQRFHMVAEAFTRFRTGLEKRVEAALTQCFSNGILNHAAFISHPAELKIRILHHICNHISGNHEPVRSEKIMRLLKSIESVTEQGEARSGGVWGKEPQRAKCKKFSLHGVEFNFQPKAGIWLAQMRDLAENNKPKQRILNAQ